MSLRTLLKVPRYGLFYFESDKTISVVPLCKVKRVFKGDNKTAGSIVELYYGQILLKAEIIAVGGKRVFCLFSAYIYSACPDKVVSFMIIQVLRQYCLTSHL